MLCAIAPLLIMRNNHCYPYVQMRKIRLSSSGNRSVVYVLCNPMDCSPPGSSVHEISPGKNTGLGCHFFLQEIFLAQGSNLGLLYRRRILYHLSHQGCARFTQLVQGKAGVWSWIWEPWSLKCFSCCRKRNSLVLFCFFFAVYLKQIPCRTPERWKDKFGRVKESPTWPF